MDFERLVVWQRAMTLCCSVYQQTDKLKDFGFKQQITRSALSIPSNIAEGMERLTDKEKVYFLGVAKGSCAELRTQILVGERIGYLSPGIAKSSVQETREISAMLHALLNKIREC
ncbi:four helix bundle protein [Marinobacterium jannaschii]|uniref:four helix bundle protein n=1 Tax=Marinobacterium jannaschii TaxID=64970 RepID=UPI00047FD7D7|nr:four helix bundle protein [Marinobacterium jannaschii]